VVMQPLLFSFFFLPLLFFFVGSIVFFICFYSYVVFFPPFTEVIRFLFFSPILFVFFPPVSVSAFFLLLMALSGFSCCVPFVSSVRYFFSNSFFPFMFRVIPFVTDGVLCLILCFSFQGFTLNG